MDSIAHYVLLCETNERQLRKTPAGYPNRAARTLTFGLIEVREQFLESRKERNAQERIEKQDQRRPLKNLF
jgi:hypothetical protein